MDARDDEAVREIFSNANEALIACAGPALQLDDDERAVQRLWKSRDRYDLFNPDNPLKSPPFRIHEYGGDLDWQWMQTIALDGDTPLTERVNRICCYASNFIVFMPKPGGRDYLVGVKSRDIDGVVDLDKHGRKTFESLFGVKTLHFASAEAYDGREQNEFFSNFCRSGAMTVLKGDIPKLRKDSEGEFIASGQKKVCVNFAKLITNWKYRRNVVSYVFDPEPEAVWTSAKKKAMRTTLNWWRPFRLTEGAVMGKLDEHEDKWEVIRDHVFSTLCNGNAQLYDQLCYTMAHILQRPHQPFYSMPILQGQQGTGKSIILDALCEIIGQKMCCKTSRVQDVTGDKTDSLVNKYLVYLNEAVNPNDKRDIAALKALVTEGTWRRREFWMPPVQEVKRFRIMLDTNHEDVIDCEGNDRRWAMYECSPQVPGRDYFDRIGMALYGSTNPNNKVHEHGLMAFADFLYRFPLEKFDKVFEMGRNVIVTKLLIRQQLASMEARKIAVFELLDKPSHTQSTKLDDRFDDNIAELRLNTNGGLIDRKLATFRRVIRAMDEEDALSDGPLHCDTVRYQKILEKRDYWQKEWDDHESWNTVVHLDVLMRRFRYIVKDRKLERAPNDDAMKAMVRDIFLGEFGTFERWTRVAASKTDRENGVEIVPQPYNTDVQADGQMSFSSGGPGILKDPVLRTYVRLPTLHRARDLFRKYMGWDKCEYDPFSKHSVADVMEGVNRNKRRYQEIRSMIDSGSLETASQALLDEDDLEFTSPRPLQRRRFEDDLEHYRQMPTPNTGVEDMREIVGYDRHGNALYEGQFEEEERQRMTAAEEEAEREAEEEDGEPEQSQEIGKGKEREYDTNGSPLWSDSQEMLTQMDE